MDIVNKKVIHKAWKEGTIVGVTNGIISIEFPSVGVKRLMLSSAFGTFLKFADAADQAKYEADIAAEKVAAEKAAQENAAAEQAAMEAELARKAVEAQAKLDAMKAASSHKSSTGAKAAKPLERTPGKPMTFLVFQGDTYEEERKGQFIWAPKYTKSGNTCHHWDRLLDVREGDVILHCSHGYIQAISRAMGACVNCQRPGENTADVDWTQWEIDGRSVTCKYHPLSRTIKHGEYKDVIVQFNKAKYSPFDRDGNGNMGYLFSIEPKLAAFFVGKAAEKNPELYAEEFLKFLLIM